jgi:ABC-type phosphate/phosphonate transport system permease subunit
MPEESEITKNVSNETVSTYYYVMFIIALAATGVLVLSEVYIMLSSPKRGLMMLLRTLPTIVLAVLNSMFLYILSTRALK